MTGLANPLQGGDLVKLNLTFAEAGTIAMTVPVQPKAYEYATYSPPATPSPAATKKGAKANPTATPTP
jgi:copper(I)-binding protein